MQTSLYRRLLPRSSAADPSRVTSDPVRYLSLPDDFSEGVILLVKPPCGSSARRDLKRGFVSSHRPAVRRNAVGQIIRAGRGSVREVSAYSCPERAPEAARRRNVRRPIRYRLKMAFDRISRCFRKACNPPSRRDYSRQVVIPRAFQIQSAASEHQNRSVATPLYSARPS